MSFDQARTAILQNAVSATADGNSLETDGCAAVAFQVTGTFTATVTFQGTVNGADWVSIQAFPSTGSTGTTTATAAGVWIAPVAGLLRVRATVTWTSGTSVTVRAAAIPGATTAIAGGASVTATSVGNVAHDAADSGNPVKVGGKAETTVPAAVADGDRVDAWFDEYGRLVVLADSPAKRVQCTLNGAAPGTLAAAGDYGALDVLSQSASNGVGVAWVIPGAGRVNGGAGRIVGGVITTSVAAFAAKFRMYVFDANPSASELDDNAALSIAAGDRSKLIGTLQWATDGTNVGGVSLNELTNTLPLPFKCAAADTNLYGILVTVDAETNESAGMTVDVQLLIEQA